MTSNHSHQAAFERLYPRANLATILESTNGVVIADADQVSDHAGKPVPPITPAGMPLRWKIRLPQASIFTLTADEAVACFIDDYEPTTPDDDTAAIALDLQRQRQRVAHMQGLILNHVTTAIMDNQLAPEQMSMLQRCAHWGQGHGPLVETDCPEWTAAVPLLLFADAYSTNGRIPPGGNVVMLRTFTAAEYLTDLARHGFIHLEQSPVYASTPSTIHYEAQE